MAATSSFTEGAAVFGGGANLRQAVNNIFHVYNPDIIAVHTTCLSETIGDDIPSLVNQAREDGLIPEGKLVIHTNTPSYEGSHVTGFSNMCRSMVSYLTESSGEKKNQLNVLPGFVEPSDMREIKRILKEIGAPAVVFPDTSDVLDVPQTGTFNMYPKGGVTIPEMKSTGDSQKTLALGAFASEDAAKMLQTKAEVPYDVLDLPIGLSATDRFIEAIVELTGSEPPTSITDDRGRLLDMMLDYQQYLYGKKVAIAGDPDHVIAMTEFVVSMGMIPTYVITGTPGKKFVLRIKDILKDVNPTATVKAAADFFELHQWMKNGPVDLLISNTYGKYIARAEDVPFVRFGFPILDRVGHSYFPTVGYVGGMRLIEKITGVILDRKDRDDPEEVFELVM